jgi:hypothetical protein
MLINDEQERVLEPIIELLHGIYMKRGLTFAKYIQGTKEIKNQMAYYKLKNNIVDHLWALKGFNHL